MIQDTATTTKKTSMVDKVLALPKGGSIEVSKGSRSAVMVRVKDRITNDRAKQDRVYTSRKDSDSEVYRIYRLQ